MAAPKNWVNKHKGVATLSVANANRDGTGTVVTVFTATATNTRTFRANIVAPGPVTEGFIHAYTHDGTNFTFLADRAVRATNIAVGVAGQRAPVLPWNDVWRLEVWLPTTSDSIRMATEIGETFKITLEAESYA